jgi:hypothetical protein
MTQAPVLWGAALACALGGAMAGNALGTTPVTDRVALDSYYQTHETSATTRQHGNNPPPDHYPLVTRNGVVPVEQLSDRGLFSQARYRPVLALAAPEEVYDEDPGPGFAETERSASAPSPAALEAEGSAHGPAAGQGKIIDVQAALAMS